MQSVSDTYGWGPPHLGAVPHTQSTICGLSGLSFSPDVGLLGRPVGSAFTAASPRSPGPLPFCHRISSPRTSCLPVRTRVRPGHAWLPAPFPLHLCPGASALAFRCLCGFHQPRTSDVSSRRPLMATVNEGYRPRPQTLFLALSLLLSYHYLMFCIFYFVFVFDKNYLPNSRDFCFIHHCVSSAWASALAHGGLPVDTGWMDGWTDRRMSG